MKQKILNLSSKELSGVCGIYLISCKEHSYVGSSKNLYHRLREHRYRLLNGTHSNDFIQKVFKKHGIENFEYQILELCTPLLRIIKEKEYIDSLKPDMNLQLDPQLKTLSKYSRQKLSKSIKKGRSEGKYKTKYDYIEIEHYDYLGNYVKSYKNKEEAVKKLGISKKKIQNLAGGYRKGLVWKGVRLRYANSNVPPLKFDINPNYIGKHFDFYSEGKYAFSTVKDVWAFLAQQIQDGKKNINLEIKLKDPTRSP